MGQQHRVVLTTVSLLVIALSFGSTAKAETAVLSHPYKANAWHTLTGERGHQCSWYVRRGGASNPVRVELGTEFVREGPLPGDLNISLTEDTKGIYTCACRMNGEQNETVRKEVYFYSEGKWVGRVASMVIEYEWRVTNSAAIDVAFINIQFLAAQRYQCPDKVAAVTGEPLNISACYLPYFPEASELRTMTLVEEATGKQIIKPLRNYCATYIVNVSQPGSYHLQVTSGDGHINSASFNATVQGMCSCVKT